MNLFQRIGNGFMDFVHDNLEPWLANFLKSTGYAAVNAAIPVAEIFVAQELSKLTAAAATGDWNAFADVQASVVKQTAADLQQKEMQVGITAVSTAVNSLIVAHPDVIAAVATAAAPAPAPSA